MKSWDSPSTSEKQSARAYIVKHHPNTSQWYSAKAGIESYKGNDKEAVRIVREGLEKFQNDPYLYMMGGFYIEDDREKTAFYEKALALNPNIITGARNYYFALDKEAARTFLETWEKDPGTLTYGPEFIRGIEAEYNLRDYPKAEQHYLNSVGLMEGGNLDFDVYERLLSVRLNRLFDASKMSRNEKLAQLTPILEKLEALAWTDLTQNDLLFQHEANYYVANFCKDEKWYDYAMDYFRMAYQAYPTAECMGDMMNNSFYVHGNAIPDERVMEVIENRNDDDLKDNFLYHWNYGVYFNTDPGKSQEEIEGHYQTAMALSPFPAKKAEVFSRYFDYLERIGQVERAVGMLEDFSLDEFYDKADYYDLYQPYFATGDFQKAHDMLERAKEIRLRAENINLSYYQDRMGFLKRLVDVKKDVDEFYKNNGYNNFWDENYSEGYAINVNFATNSANIPAADHGKIDGMAKVINSTQASEYSFKIEGHTDNTGSDKINIPLSRDRAKSVAKYLNDKHNIPLYRMEVEGFGSSKPISLNDSPQNRAKNRRVEANLSVNISKPIISTTTALDTDYLAFSKDGKFFASGYNPMQIWDAEKGVVLKTYPHIFGERKFSSDGRYIAATMFQDKQQAMAIFDNNLGQIVQVLPVSSNSGTISFDWAPRGHEMVVVTMGNRTRMFVYDAAKRKVVRNSPIENDLSLKEVKWSPKGDRVAVMEKGQVGVIRLFDANDLQPLRVLDEPNWPHAIGFNTDGSRLIVLDNQRKLNLWDTETWEHHALPSPVISSDIKAHPTRKNIVSLDDWGGGENNMAVLMDLETGQPIASRDVGAISSYNIDFLGEDKVALYSFMSDEVVFYDLSLDRKLGAITGSSEGGHGIYVDRSNDYIISFDGEGVHVWDLLSGRKENFWNDQINSLVHSDREEHLFYGIAHDSQGKTSTLIRYDTDSFKRESILELPYQVTHWGTQRGELLFAGTDFVPSNTGNEYGRISKYDANTLERINEIQIYLPTNTLAYGRLGGSGFYDVALSPDNKKVMVLTQWVDGYRTRNIKTERLREYHLGTGEETKNIPLGFAPDKIAYSSNNAYRVNNTIYDYIKEAKTGNEYSKIINPIGKHSGTDSNLELPEKNLSIGYNSHLNTMYYASLEEPKKPLVTIAVKKDNEWIAFAETGEFSSSLNGTDKTFWLLGSKMLPFDAFRSRFEQPNLLKRKIEGIIQNHVQVIEDEPNIEPETFEIPYEVTISSQTDITVEDSYTLELEVEKLANDIPDPKFVYSVNGRSYAASRGFVVVPEKQGDNKLRISKKFDLTPGKNTIEAFIDYKGVKVPKGIVTITKKSDQPLVNITSNTHLWFFGVGVKEYQKVDQNLEYADRDIQKVADYFREQEGKLYKKVHIKTLLNTEATERNVRIEMNEFLKKASAEDVIVLYVAGHGVQDNEQELYFMTHDAELSKPYTGMSIDKFKDFLRSRPINQKALFWIDICHAGTVSTINRRGMASSGDAFKALSEGTGTIVFASSTGKQSSLESSEWGGGHGAFTYAILLGLDGHADLEAGDGDGMVSILELQSYVSRKVPELTDGNQHPTTPESYNVKDFPIFKL